jgi:hypothetical protein
MSDSTKNETIGQMKQRHKLELRVCMFYYLCFCIELDRMYVRMYKTKLKSFKKKQKKIEWIKKKWNQKSNKWKMK